MVSLLPTVLSTQLTICTFINSESLTQSVTDALRGDRYVVTQLSSFQIFFDFVEQHKQQLDCLILQSGIELPPTVNRLYEQGTLLPVILIRETPTKVQSPESELGQSFREIGDTLTAEEISTQAAATYLYHPAEVQLSISQLDEVIPAIDQAIAQFLALAPSCRLPNRSTSVDFFTELTTQNFLMLQQRRLAEKLKERLGYLGVYYKRNPQNFFRHLAKAEREKLLQQLQENYRAIILNYFSKESDLNQQIDLFITTTFFTDMSVSQVVEIHMELMDEFSKHLRMEGRSDEVLLDYRLTLIDVLAHLCEMYRRSIPREL